MESEASSDSPSVFICYCRADQNPSRLLGAALEQSGVIVHADWHLPATIPYEQYLADSIASCSLFVLVLTPASLNSSECSKEIQEAIEFGKRLAPIVLTAVDPMQVPAPVRAINWMRWPESEQGYCETAATLKRAIARDFKWEREHARLVNRLREWVDAGRSDSYLLRQDELLAAESWLSRAISDPTLSPRPTTAIDEFITHSRERQKKAQLRTLVAVAAAIAVVFGVGLLAMIQSQKRELAEVAADVERVRGIEERGRQHLIVGESASAAKLLLDAYESKNHLAGDESKGLRVMLARSLAQYYGRRLVLTGGDPIIDAEFSPDDKRIVTIAADGQLRLWNIATESEIFSGHGDESSRFIRAAFSPDGSRLVAHEATYHESDDPENLSHYELSAKLLRATDGEELAAYETDETEYDPADFRPAPILWQADRFSIDAGKSFLKVEDGELIDGAKMPEISGTQVSAPAPRPAIPCARSERQTWASSDGSYWIDARGMLYRGKDCEWTTHLEASSPIRKAVFSKDGRFVLAAYEDGAIVWEWSQARPTLRMQAHTDAYAAAFSDVGSKQVVVAIGAETELAPRVVGEFSLHTFRHPRAELIPLSERAIGSSGGSTVLIDTRTGSVVAKLDLPVSERQGQEHHGIDVWQADPRGGRLLVKHPHQWDVVSTTTFKLRDLSSGKTLHTTKALGDYFDAIAFDWNSLELFTASLTGTNASVWTCPIGTWPPEYVSDVDRFEGLVAAAYGPHGGIVTIGKDRTLRSLHGLHRIKMRSGDITSLVVSSDGRYAIASSDEATEIVDLEAEVALGICPGTSSGDRWSINPDNTLVATATQAAVNVCELATGRILLTLSPPDSPSAPRFSAVRNQLLFQAGSLTQIWDVSPETRSAAEIRNQLAQVHYAETSTAQISKLVESALPKQPVDEEPQPEAVAETPLSDEEKIRRLVAEQLGVRLDAIGDKDRFVDDLGADELDLIEMCMAIEEEFNFEIPEEQWSHAHTISDVVAVVRARSR